MKQASNKTRINSSDVRADTQYAILNTQYGKAGLTLVEMIIAVALIVIVFTAITPLFRGILNSWDSKAGAAETIQNGRVLIDHLNHNLSKAVQISAVSDSNVTTGYIEFEDNDGNTLRYDIASNYVEFGVVGNLSDLAGPVSTLQFTCYDVCDLDTPITDVNEIRTVEVQTTLTNSADLGEDRTFTTTVYLRVNDSNGTGGGGDPNITKGTPCEFDGVLGSYPALAQINGTHYLCAYSGPSKSMGWAVVLAVNTGTWEITKKTPFEFDTTLGKFPALEQIDPNHYLCTYCGPDKSGITATILTVDTGTWTITQETPLTSFDVGKGGSALAQIDPNHYLCAYHGDGDDGWSVVLTVDTGAGTITEETPFEFDGVKGKMPTLEQIDPNHYLLAYQGDGDDGHAAVLTVNTGTWVITKETPLEFDDVMGKDPALAQIDPNHYLLAYTANGNLGTAEVLTVNTGTWTITEETPFTFDTTEGLTPALAQIDSTNYLLAYDGGTTATGWAAILTVDTGTWGITTAASYNYDTTMGETPALAQIDPNNYLCAYEGEGSDGYAVVLKPDLGGDGEGEILP